MSLFAGAASRRLASNWSRHILYVDRGVVVLNKPSGLICQKDRPGDSLQDPSTTQTKFKECLNSIQTDLSLSSNPYPVPSGTTGTLLLATTLQSAQGLSQQFQQGTIEKIYLALVRGGDKSFPVKSGVIKTPLKYHDGRVSLENSRWGKPSLTEWSVIASSPIAPLSLLRLRLLTGRKHQLRVHMSQCLKAPILGDDLYSNTGPSKDIISSTEIPPNRMYLHAHETSFFKYRVSKPHKRFRLGVSAPVPRDFLKICADTQINVNSLCVKGGLFVDGEPAEDGKVSAVEGYWYNNLKFHAK
ncbi:pseudouridine synthase [Amanita rubescens]|nr:pseudouridine synthase [Amanita rubescens]